MLKAYGAKPPPGAGGGGGGTLTGGGPKHGGTFGDDALAGLGRNSRIWFSEDQGTWVGGVIVSMADGMVSIKSDKSGALLELPAARVQPANPEMLEGVNDLTQLSYLNEPSILYNLGVRYTKDQIYTRAGPVLVAVNPFRKVPLYTQAIVDGYVNSAGAADGMREPHIFLIADNAFRHMQKEGRDQSIIVSGESGAGKTETTKYAMQYVARLAGGTGVEDRVLETNPILETFGNAKTLRNNNSSRFGKLIDIFFTPSGKIAGANIQTYLLEKSRVIARAKGERSYHIFYQLCSGASEEERATFHIKSAEHYDYLSMSKCLTIDGVDDAKDFEHLRAALKVVDVSPEEQAQVFSLLAAVLWLGNVHFAVGPDESVRVERGEALTAAAALLHVRSASLELALTQRKIAAGKEIVTQPLKFEQAVDSRDALAKSIYSSIFDWLVSRINDALDVHRTKAAKTTTISILDIYGFECFDRNGFEQLCINFANERLQQQFNLHLFKLEQEEYSREKIDWAHIDFEDNQECVDLIEKKPFGVLSLLDEQCMFPKATDTTFASKLAEHLSSNKHFKKSPREPTGFDVLHYAGSVNYDATGFLDKNKDVLFADLIGLMGRSTSAMLRDFATTVDAAAASKKIGGGRGGASQSQSVGSRFKDQLSALMQRLDATEPHFVRCIKPNDRQAPHAPDPALMLHQLKCCGVLEVVRISCQGYPTRYAHELFVSRYAFLLPDVMQDATGGSSLQQAKDIVRFFRLDPALYQVGLTKLFFRAGTVGQIEDMRTRTLSSVVTLQKETRRFVARRRYVRMRQAAIRIEKHARGHRARVAYEELKKNWYAAIAVQRMYKGHVRRQGFLRDRHYVVIAQMAARRWLLGNRLRRRERERRRLEAEDRRREAKEANRKLNDREARKEAELEAQERAATERAIAAAGGAAALGGAGAAGAGGPGGAGAGARGGGAGARAMQVQALEGLTARVGTLETENAELRSVLQEERERTDFYSKVMTEWEETLGSQVEEIDTKLQHARELLGGDRALAPPSEASSSGPASPSGKGTETKQISDASQAILQGLTQEFEHRSRVFDDDAEFLWEVKAGKEVADLDPETELMNLRNRFEFWKKDFKVRLKDTKDLLKKIDKDRTRQQTLIQTNYYQQPAGGAPGGAGGGEGGAAASTASPEDKKKKKGLFGKLGFGKS